MSGDNSAKDGKENNGPMQAPLDAKNSQDYQSQKYSKDAIGWG